MLVTGAERVAAGAGVDAFELGAGAEVAEAAAVCTTGAGEATVEVEIDWVAAMLAPTRPNEASAKPANSARLLAAG